MRMSKMSKAVRQSGACAGNGCAKLGTEPFEIIYLNKTGWFCESCKKDLILDGLLKIKESVGPAAKHDRKTRGQAAIFEVNKNDQQNNTPR